MGFLEDFDDPPAVTGEIVPVAPLLPVAQQKQVALRRIEDQLLDDVTGIMSGVLKAADIPDEDEGVPPEWVAQYGQKEAEKRHRLARYGKMSRKEAPVALFLAQGVHSSIIKARSTEKAGNRVLNVTMVNFPKANVEYPRRKLDAEK